MKQQNIYELAIWQRPALQELRRREPSVVFFSNLKKTIENLTSALALHGWEPALNYSAVYRSVNLKGKFSQDYAVEGIVFFRVVIGRKILNPVLPMLEIDDKPRKPRRLR
ncbi:MAG: hypothetical protein LH606_11615 [Cytophagaceae bacterium]|nr:hypothetical protein [Cytophagaceae bacterium]